MAEAGIAPAPVPKWVIGAGATVATTLLGLIITLLWTLMGGGLDAYVDARAKEIIATHEVTDDGTTQSAKLATLTTAVNNLTTAIETSETRDKEFREQINGRLDALTNAIVELAR